MCGVSAIPVLCFVVFGIFTYVFLHISLVGTVLDLGVFIFHRSALLSLSILISFLILRYVSPGIFYGDVLIISDLVFELFYYCLVFFPHLLFLRSFVCTFLYLCYSYFEDLLSFLCTYGTFWDP